MKRLWSAPLLIAFALLALVACGQTASSTVPPTATRTPRPATPLAGSGVWPTLREAQPAQVAPNERLRISGSGGYLRDADGAFVWSL